MKLLLTLGLILSFYGCSGLLKPKSLTARFPSSVNGKVITPGSDFFSNEMKEGEFHQFIQEAQTRGYKQIEILPQQESLSKISMTEETSIAGDFYLLIGTNFSEKDELIRKGDFDDIYAVAKRMSWLKFRVTLNLVASVVDLKNALANTRPTIITWTSHGNTGSFYDFNHVPVPADIFQNASPSVYQFHLASCEGYQAIQNKYQPFIPKTMKHWAWQTLTYHPGTLKPHFAREDWNPYINYPGVFSYKGMVCQPRDTSFVIYDSRKKQTIGNYNYTKVDVCNYMIANGTEGHVCSKVGETWELYNRRNLQVVPGKPFDNHYDCISRITNIRNGFMCRRYIDTDKFHTVNAVTHERSEKTFDGLKSCYEYIDSVKGI